MCSPKSNVIMCLRHLAFYFSRWVSNYLQLMDILPLTHLNSKEALAHGCQTATYGFL